MTAERETPPAPMSAREFALRHNFKAYRETLLPAQTQAAILRQCPGLCMAALADALDGYRFAEILAPLIPANDRKAGFSKVADLSRELASAIEALGAIDRAPLQRFLSAGRKAGITGFKVKLLQLAEVARRAAKSIEPSAGRPLTRKAYVIRDVARELHRCGYSIDSSSKGPLVFIATELFALTDDPPSDVRSLVRNALAKIDLTTLDFRQSAPL